MNVYIITLKEHEDSISFGCSFSPIVYKDLEKAETQLNKLNNLLEPYCGYYYSLEHGTLEDE